MIMKNKIDDIFLKMVSKLFSRKKRENKNDRVSDKEKMRNEETKKEKKVRIVRKMNIERKKIFIIKLFFSIMFASLFIVLTKVKLTPIIGTQLSFSASVMFGPIISKFVGITFGTASILISHFFGVIVGIYKIKSIVSYFIFLPIICAGIYFARIFKSEKKLVWLPIICISLFILHPIGNSVWFYSLFWTIPIIITIEKERIEKIVKNYAAKVYLYSLGTAFVDHAVGSTLFLYFMNIPKEAWLMAIPLTIIERLIIAFGITLSYFFVKISIKALKEVFQSLAVVEIEDEKEKDSIKVSYKVDENEKNE